MQRHPVPVNPGERGSILIIVLVMLVVFSVAGAAPACTVDSECDDGNVCTDDSCDSGTGTCVNTDNTASCDDGDACTTADTCSAGSCVGGAPPNCDDANVCTDDSCDSGTGCVNTNNTAPCDDGAYCTDGDVLGAPSTNISTIAPISSIFRAK